MEERKAVSLDDFLLRRGFNSPEHKYLNPDGSATSRVFKLREKDNLELSVDIESMTTHERSIGDSKRFFLFRIANSVVQKFNLSSVHDPDLKNSNDAHAVILGMTMDDEISPSLLAQASRKV